MRDDIAAVVLDSPFADFVHFAEFYMDRMGFPGRGFQRLSIGLAAKIAQADFRGVRPLDWILKIRCPLMIISPVNDPANSPGDTEAIEASVASRSRGQDDVFWRILSAGHGLGMVAEPVEYADRIRKFVGHALSQSPEKA
jgi:hypothetical protein